MSPQLTISMIAFLAPPAEFDYQATESYTLIRQSFTEIQETCAGTYIDFVEYSLGCTDVVARVVFIPLEFEGEVYDLIFRHEQAHLNGWRH